MNPYLLLAAAGISIGLAIGGFFYGEHIQKQSDAIAIDRQKLEAATVLQAETMRVRAAEAHAADLAATLETAHATATASIADHDRQLADAMRAFRLRNAGGCRPGSRNAEAAGAGTGKPEDIAGGGATEQLPAGSGEFIQRCARAADTVSAWARECWGFVHANCGIAE